MVIENNSTTNNNISSSRRNSFITLHFLKATRWAVALVLHNHSVSMLFKNVIHYSVFFVYTTKWVSATKSSASDFRRSTVASGRTKNTERFCGFVCVCVCTSAIRFLHVIRTDCRHNSFISVWRGGVMRLTVILDLSLAQNLDPDNVVWLCVCLRVCVLCAWQACAASNCACVFVIETIYTCRSGAKCHGFRKYLYGRRPRRNTEWGCIICIPHAADICA